jgi:hypothetical protein
MSRIGRGSWSALSHLGLLSSCAVLVSACSFVQLDQLVPSTAIDIVSSDGNLLEYVPNVCGQKDVAEIFRSHAKVTSNVSKLRTALPAEIAQNSVVNKLINHSHYVSTRAVQAASMVLKNSPAPPTVYQMPSDVGLAEVFDFGKLVMGHVMRHTPSASSPSEDPLVDQFWNNLKAYYAFYFQGKFYTYLGQSLAAPSPSSTISDAEIVQATQVFSEFLFDEIFQSTVWATYDSTGKNIVAYYPGGTKNKPTYLAVNGSMAGTILKPLPTTTSGCGMNELKAQAIDSLVKQFGTAASAEVGLLVKSAGAIEIGLGVFGKLNVGDNNLVAELAKGFAAEVVSRLTIQLAVPILSAIDFEQQKAMVARVQAPLAALGGPRSAAALKAARMRVLISPFVSAGIKPL